MPCRTTEAIAVVPPHDIPDGIPGMLVRERAILRDLGFDTFESEYLIAYYVEEHSLRELPARLWCTRKDVELLRARVNRKITKLRREIYRTSEDSRFGTG
jgi:hypothetical protein